VARAPLESLGTSLGGHVDWVNHFVTTFSLYALMNFLYNLLTNFLYLSRNFLCLLMHLYPSTFLFPYPLTLTVLYLLMTLFLSPLLDSPGILFPLYQIQLTFLFLQCQEEVDLYQLCPLWGR